MTSLKLKSFLTGLLFILFRVALAQPISIRHYTIDNGLPTNTIYSLYRDSKGFLWAATDKGIVKFNGITFQTLTTQDGLPDNEVFNLREDRQGRLWFSTFKGFLSFYKDGKFFTPENTPWLKLPIRNTSFIGHIRVNYDGSITNPSAGGDYFVQVKNNSAKLFNISHIKKVVEASSISSRPLHVIKLNDNQYTIYYSNSIITIDSNARVINKSKTPNNLTLNGGNSSKDEIIYSIKTIMRFTERQQVTFKAEDIGDKYHQLGDSSIRMTYFKGKDFLFTGKNRSTISDRLEGIFDNTYVTFGEEDLVGNLWISTLGNGLFCVSRYEKYITTAKAVYKGSIFTAKNINGKIYFLTSNGEYKSYQDNTISPLLNIVGETTSLTNRNFLILENGDLLKILGNKSFMFNINKSGKSSGFKIDVPWEKSATTKEIIKFGDQVYFSSISNIIRASYNNLITKPSWENIIHIRSKNDHESRIYARAVNPRDSALWFSRADGMFKISGKAVKQQTQFKTSTYRTIAFYSDYLLGITDDNKLLINGNFERKIKTDTIIEANCIWENIYPIDNSRLLISTNNYYRLLTLYKQAEDGKPRYALQTVEHPFVPLRADYIIADTNHFHFFKDGSIVSIATPVLFEKTPPPVPVFSSFKALDKSYFVRPEIRISYDQSKSINITFDNISFVGKDITCQYSITDNGKDEWREITGNEINLNTPGYGNYLIKIRSKTLSSGYSKPAVIRLVVQKPFWATWWFISLCALALIALVWGIIVFITWRKLRKKQKEHDADMKYQQSEYKALNALMNPHFIFNSLNNIQGLINKDEKRIANEYLVIFSDLVRQNMHNISKGFISLQQELTLIENYLTLEKLRFKELVNYEITVDEEVDVDDIMIPPLMIQPLVENAVKHGLLPKQSASSKVTVQVYEKDDLLYIVIEDNGVGLTHSLQSENKLHESFGLSNLQKRTEHLKKIQEHEINIEVMEMKNSDGTVKGTQAVVTIKLNEV